VKNAGIEIVGQESFIYYVTPHQITRKSCHFLALPGKLPWIATNFISNPLITKVSPGSNDFAA
jgi:hypothetical protein